MKSFNTKFKSGGLHEKHVVATWNLGNHLSICLQAQGNREQLVSRWPVAGPSEYWLLGSSPASKYPIFLSDFNEIWVLSTDFRKILKFKISWKSVQWDQICSMRKEGRTDGRTYMTRLTVAFRNLANAHKKKGSQWKGRRFYTSASPDTLQNNESQNKGVNCLKCWENFFDYVQGQKWT